MFKPRQTFAFTALLTLNACAGKGSFSGSSAKPDSPKPQSADAASQSQSAATERDASPATPATPMVQATATPAPPLAAAVPALAGAQDIWKSGFQCGPALTTAAGQWSGTYTGTAVGLIGIGGQITFTFAAKDTQSLSTKDFLIFGSLFGHDFVKSSTISFDLKCGDVQLPDSLNPHGIITIRRTFKLLSQSWNPPAFAGTWKSSVDGSGIEIASGSFSVAKSTAP